MKLNIFFVALLCLMGGSFGQFPPSRFHLPIVRPPHPFMSPMMANPFEKAPTSEIDQLLNDCLAKLPQPVDVVVDVKSGRIETEDYWWPFGPSFGAMPTFNFDVIDFVDGLAKKIVRKNLYVVLVDGVAENRTKYYLHEQEPPEPTVTTTTQEPVTRFERTNENGVSMVRWFYSQSLSHGLDEGQQRHDTLRRILSKALSSRIVNAPIEYPKEKDPSAPETMFTVVITDSAQRTPLSVLTPDNPNTIILDIGGKVAVNELHYLKRNLLIVPDYSSLGTFSQAVQFMICQAAGGNYGQVAEPEQERMPVL